MAEQQLQEEVSSEIVGSDAVEGQGNTVELESSNNQYQFTPAGSPEAMNDNCIQTATAYRELQRLDYHHQSDLQRTSISTRLHGYVRKFCPQPIYNALKPPQNRKEWKSFWLVHVPILHWLYYYVPKYIIGDTVAGLTIGVTHIPQGIGFALLASVPPVFGLYSSFIPVLLYTVFGTSKHLSVGTFPIVSLMTASSIDRLTSQYSPCLDSNATDDVNSTINNDDDCYLSSCDQYKVEIAVTLSLVVGIVMLLMSLLKLGFVSLFLSDALISGYTAAAAFSIVVTQISPMFGLKDASVPDGWFITPRKFILYCTRIVQGKLTPAAIITSIICFIILIIIELTNRFIKKRFKKFPIHIPGQLIVVILTTFIAYIAMLNERFDLKIINVDGGIPPGKCFVPSLPNGGLFIDVLFDAVEIAIVGFALNIAQAKLLAIKNGYTIHPDQELFAYGIMNMGGAFFGSIPTAGALSRTVLQDAVGGNTQLVGLISSALVLFVILILGFLFGNLPNAAVAVIVVMALKGLMFQIRDVRRYYYIHWPDMLVWFVVFFATLLIRLDVGLLAGVFFSMLVIITRTILPYSTGLGEAKEWSYSGNQDDGSEHKEPPKVLSIPGVYIYQFNAPVYYANCGVFRTRLYIDCNIDQKVFDKIETSCFTSCYRRGFVKQSEFGVQRLDETSSNTEQSTEVDDNDLIPGSPTPMITSGDNQLLHTIIIDCGPIGFVDSMGSAMIEKVVTEFDSLNIQVLLASPTTPVCDALYRYGFFKRYSSERVFPSITSAVDYAKRGSKVSTVADAKRLSKRLATNFERQLAFPARPTLLEPSTVERRKGASALYQTKPQAETSL